MESPQVNVAIDGLTFSLFQRPLHPELFNIYAQRDLKTEKIPGPYMDYRLHSRRQRLYRRCLLKRGYQHSQSASARAA